MIPTQLKKMYPQWNNTELTRNAKSLVDCDKRVPQ